MKNNKKIKLLIINTVHFGLNGVTSVIMNYYRNMDKSNMKIDFIVINKISDEYRIELESNGSKIYQLPRKRNILKYQLELYKIIKKNQYGIIHVHGNSSTMLVDILPAKWAKVPVRIVHSHNTTCTHLKSHKILYPIFKKTYTHGFACGQEAGKWLFHNKPFIEIKNGIDLKKYSYNEQTRNIYRKKINAKDNIVIGHIGNFVEQKNHSFLIDIFAELISKNSNYQLLLISDGYLMQQIKEKVHNLGLDNNVIFLGKITDVQNYMQAIDIFVLPSLYEGLPVALVEAQATGLPCLVSNTVAKESNLTDSLKFLSIDNTSIWVENLIKLSNENELDTYNRIEKSKEYQLKISNAGYDINNNANIMKEKYFEFIKELQC